MKALVVGSGYAALVLLFMVLLIGPLARITKKKFFLKLIPHRRNLGVMTFIVAFIHSALSMFYHGIKPPLSKIIFKFFYKEVEGQAILYNEFFGNQFLFGIFGPEWFNLALDIGVFALIGLAILSITSFNYAVRVMGSRLWKNTQKFTYIILILSILHSVMYRFVGAAAKRNTPWDNLLFILTMLLVLFVIIVQLIGFFKTKKIRKDSNIKSEKLQTITTLVATSIVVFILFLIFLWFVLTFLRPQ